MINSRVGSSSYGLMCVAVELMGLIFGLVPFVKMIPDSITVPDVSSPPTMRMDDAFERTLLLNDSRLEDFMFGYIK